MIVSQALADGYTHVLTLSGPMPLQLFPLRDALGMKYEIGRASCRERVS
jgi:hypothetical protein